MMNKFILMTCLCSLLMACQHSPKKNYFYLTPINTTEKSSTDSASVTQLIGLGPIDIPEYLTRSQIIDSQADNSLVMADNAYWAEPLDKSIARVISLNLIHMNVARSIVDFPWRNDSKPRYSFRLHIDDLSRNGKNATINAIWELVDNGNKTTLMRHHFVRSISAESGAKGLAQSYSQLLADLSREMDEALNKNP